MADEASEVAEGRPPAHSGQRRKKRSSKSDDKRRRRASADGDGSAPAESKGGEYERGLRETESSAQFAQWTDAMQRQQVMDRFVLFFFKSLFRSDCAFILVQFQKSLIYL